MRVNDRQRWSVRARAWRRALALAVLAGAPAVVSAEIYCIDPTSKAVVVSPVPCRPGLVPSAAEITAAIEAAREAVIAGDVRRDTVRADRQLVAKFPDERAHRKAERVDLEAVAVNLHGAMLRLDALRAKARPLYDEIQFYLGKPVPPALLRSIEENNASLLAMADVFRGLRGDIETIVHKYEHERERLRRLWSGAAPGSMGLLDGPASAPLR
jgi:nucleotide-binding universal stress UspA family protein